MAKKKKEAIAEEEIVYAPIQPQLITDTIEKNYMPYVMSVIVSRAIPEIDGLKPAHRKLLYTMYKMGLLSGGLTKSANIVGATMKLNPHGDAAIYETMVRLTRGHEALLHPLVESKGSFGKHYSSDMKYAASRYTECKLAPICTELFSSIDKDAVDMVDNYDGTMEEPVLLPTTFPNVLVMPNTGIAVGMASNTCSFNLGEVCDGAIALLKHPNLTTDKLMDIMKAPDFPGGGIILYDREQMRNIYETGSGGFRIRSRYTYDKDANCIDIVQVPYSTTIELIIKKIADLVKEGKIKEIVDFRDEIDLDGFKLTIDIRRGVDPDKLMNKLFKMTPLEDTFKCNFNILIDSVPRQMGVLEILQEWIIFRTACVRRELNFDLGKKNDKLHLLMGLGKILLDIDKAIRIIRRTEKEEDVIPNLEAGFDIDEVQANYIADIKLRNLNRQYILNRIAEIEDLQKQIAEIEGILADELKLRNYIAAQLVEIKKKYGAPRKSQIVHLDTIPDEPDEPTVENYPVRVVLTAEGYFKKITMRSLQGNDTQMLKDGDRILASFDANNVDELLIFSDQAQLYRMKLDDFDNVKASVLGDFLPAKLGMNEGEKPVYVRIFSGYPEDENMVFLFANGKGVRIPMSAYQTKSVRRKLTGAYSSASPFVAAFYEKEKEPFELLLINNADRAAVIKTSLIPKMSTRTSGGNQVVAMKKGQSLQLATDQLDGYELKGLRRTKLPATVSTYTRTEN